jgi:hypothetical protein
MSSEQAKAGAASKTLTGNKNAAKKTQVGPNFNFLKWNIGVGKHGVFRRKL